LEYWPALARLAWNTLLSLKYPGSGVCGTLALQASLPWRYMVGSASKAYRDYGSDQPIKPLSQVWAKEQWLQHPIIPIKRHFKGLGVIQL